MAMLRNFLALRGLVQKGGSGGGGSTPSGGDLQKSTIGDLKLFDIVKFGRWDGHDLYWFVSDTDYEGHTILTATPVPHLELSMNIFDSGLVENVRDTTLYRTSSIRQFLNAESDVWFSEKYTGDLPTEYASKPGFLYDFTQNEKNAIDAMEVKAVEYSGISSSDYSANSFYDKVWIASKKQCGGHAGTAEGSRAFGAAAMSISVVWDSLDGKNIFNYTRTQSATSPKKLEFILYNSSYSPDITNFKPISLSLKKDTIVSGYQTPEAGRYLWEVQA